MAKKKSDEQSTLNVLQLNLGIAQFCVLGQTALIQNRMAEKARMELLFPRGGCLSSADAAGKLKNDPIVEFRSAAYAPRDKNYQTRLIIPARAFGKALAEAALDTPGA
jgi:hypothetical protein